MPRSILAAAQAPLLSGKEVCALTPETTAGPFYLDEELLRSDIREDREGETLTLRLQAVDADCAPLAGARVDVWHCDAAGVYSSFGGGSPKGETFLRGSQFADSNGIVEFITVYPGWYPGRTTHIHFRIYLDDRSALTGQIFFPDDVSDEIYRTASAYSRQRSRRAYNANDWIAQRAGSASRAGVSGTDDGFVAELVIGVDRSA